MKRIKSISFIGGDKRMIYMRQCFDFLGYQTFALTNLIDESIIKNSDAVIFPLPISDKEGNITSNSEIKYKISDIAGMISNESIAFGGMISEKTKQIFSENGIKIFDYFKRDEVVIKNVIPTVQGILKTIFNNIDYTLFSSKCAVFGYGRVGKITAETLASLGADVTVFARKKSDLALAEAKRHKAVNMLEKANVISEFQIIINTVPSLIIGKEMLSKAKKNVLIIDIASAPYGVDFDEAKRLKINALLCPSLPGKTAPVTAGKILSEGVLNIMKEEGYE